jgi:hypothetical protein
MELLMDAFIREQAEKIEVVFSGNVSGATPGVESRKFHPQVSVMIVNSSEDSIDRVRIVWREKGENASRPLAGGGNNVELLGYEEITFVLGDHELQRFITLSPLPEFKSGWELKTFENALAQANRAVEHFEIVLGFRDTNKVLWNRFPDGRLEPHTSNT